MVSEADAAFVGVLRDFSEVEAEVPIWTFEVESVHIGELGPDVKVAAPRGSGGCGLDLDAGERAAVLLSWVEPGESTLVEADVAMWHTSFCSTGEPEQLAAFAPPRPPDPAVGLSPVPERDDVPDAWLVWAVAFVAVAAVGVTTVVLVGRRRPSPSAD